MYKSFNTSKVLRARKDIDHPYTKVSSYWNDSKKLNGYERAIMLELMSNSDDFIIDKDIIKKRLGFPDKKFEDAWKSLKEKHFIFIDKKGKKKGHNIVIREAEILENDTGPTAQKPSGINLYRETFLDDPSLTIINRTMTNITKLETRDSSATEQDNTNISFGKPNGKLLEPVPADLLATENIFDNSIDKNSSLLNPGKIDFRPADIDINCNESIFDIDIEMEGVSKPDVIHIEKKKLGPEALF